MTTISDEALDELRTIRIAISEKFNHDIRKLATYYQELERELAESRQTSHTSEVMKLHGNVTVETSASRQI